jgi:phosphatidylglycerol lysyltransferase
VKKRRLLPVILVTLVTLGSGLVNVYSVTGRSLPHRIRWLREVFPLDFIHLSRLLTLLIGFALVVSSIHIYKRKKRACQVVLILSALSAGFHLTKGLDYEEAAFSLILFGILFMTRRTFTVRSSIPEWRGAMTGLGIALAIAFAYGVAGFWFLDPREFGIDFTVADAVHRTLRFLTFAGDADIVPRTRHAHWFLNSLELMTSAMIVYSASSLFRPALYHFRTLPHERELAASLVRHYGRSTLDFFKYRPDKSFFFSASRKCFLGYRVGGSYAIVLGDPVGPEDEIEEAVHGFRELCRENDWGHYFYQTLPDFLPRYMRLGYHKLKIGDDAIVDLERFTLEGKERKKMRSRVNQLEKQGTIAVRIDPPVPDEALQQLKEVSDEWLEIPGRRERIFTLGKFEPDYVRSSPVFVAQDRDGRFLAFVNLIPSYRKGEGAIDLMRHRLQAPNGAMDFLFVKLLLNLRERGFQRFNLGMAPMAGFQEHENASREERAVHYFMRQLTFIFSFEGIRAFKAKFATSWEPRYAIYPKALDLPRLAFALRKVSELPEAQDL